LVNISIGAAFHDLSIVLQNYHVAPVNKMARCGRKVAGASCVHKSLTEVTHALLFHPLFLVTDFYFHALATLLSQINMLLDLY